MGVQLTDPAELEGVKVTGRDGSKLGKVEVVYLDDLTARPEWVAVKSGFFGTDVSLVPLATSEYDGAELRVPYAKEQLRQAPHHDPGQELTPADEADLFRYYGIAYDDVKTTRGQDTSGPKTDDAMTRSEEKLRVGTETTPTGKARLRKHVVTEHQQVTVPVSHEEVHVEREPITDANRDEALDGPDISEEEHEITLRAERPVAQTKAEPVERVRLGTETVTEEQQLSGEVRKEQIEIDENDRRK